MQDELGGMKRRRKDRTYLFWHKLAAYCCSSSGHNAWRLTRNRGIHAKRLVNDGSHVWQVGHRLKRHFVGRLEGITDFSNGNVHLARVSEQISRAAKSRSTRLGTPNHHDSRVVQHFAFAHTLAVLVVLARFDEHAVPKVSLLARLLHTTADFLDGVTVVFCALAAQLLGKDIWRERLDAHGSHHVANGDGLEILVDGIHPGVDLAIL